MRKWFITMITLLLAFTACRQEEPVLINDGNRVDLSNLRFNITIQHPDGTKGIKTDWENGDKVFIFISGCTTGYLTTSYNGTVWTEAYVDAPIFGASGNLQAVYLPYGNNTHPTYIENENKWTFDEGTDTYYFYASNVPYTVETIGAEQVFSAAIQMVKPGTYVQFYIPYASASGTIQLACNALRPAVITGISASNGAVSVNTGNAGTPITGYADTLAGEEGYYVSGIPVIAASETADYYFALKIGDDYSHYYKNRTSLAPNKAYQLPSYSNWPRVGGSRHVQVANGSWKTVNEGAEHPWDLGELKDNSFVPSSGEDLPDETDWSNLIDSQKAAWMPMDIWGSHGSLVLSVSAPNKYIYIPWSGSITNYWMAGFANSFDIADNGTSLVIPNPASIPGSGEAYVRTIRNANYFRIKATEDGTTMTFQYKDGSVQFSTDYGETWPDYDGRTFNLNAGDEVWFKGSRTDCNLSGSKQLFNANHVCYIAGDIASLLANPTSLKANAFRSAFSFGALQDSQTELENSLPTVSGTVDWVDIDPDDPLILPESTAANCYLEMFYNCTSLHSAPDLPATVLEDKCYFRMFYGCKGLSSLPLYPSVVTMSGTSTERRYCFQMFQNCTGIEELDKPLFVGQNSTMARGCFEDMFAHCTSLKTVISGLLPATTLATNCYRGMFQDTAIKSAPDLLAETLVSNCYRFMFNACKSLEYIKCYSTTNVSNDSYTRNWLQNAKTTGTFHYREGTSWYRNNQHGIPNGWTPVADPVQ